MDQIRYGIQVDYKILYAHNWKSLEKEVGDYLCGNHFGMGFDNPYIWIAVGSICYNPNSDEYYQAIVKYEPDCSRKNGK